MRLGVADALNGGESRLVYGDDSGSQDIGGRPAGNRVERHKADMESNPHMSLCAAPAET